MKTDHLSLISYYSKQLRRLERQATRGPKGQRRAAALALRETHQRIRFEIASLMEINRLAEERTKEQGKVIQRKPRRDDWGSGAMP